MVAVSNLEGYKFIIKYCYFPCLKLELPHTSANDSHNHCNFKIYNLFYRYSPDGNTLGTVESPPPAPIRLQWDLANEELTKAIDTSFVVAQKLLNDVDLRILMYTKYGKGLFYIHTH